jgi:hypothetical protein
MVQVVESNHNKVVEYLLLKLSYLHHLIASNPTGMSQLKILAGHYICSARNAYNYLESLKPIINKVFPQSVIAGCNFHFNQCLWRQIQTIRLTV